MVVHIITGVQGSGKSTLLRQISLAHAIATGNPYGQHFNVVKITRAVSYKLHSYMKKQAHTNEAIFLECQNADFTQLQNAVKHHPCVRCYVCDGVQENGEVDYSIVNFDSKPLADKFWLDNWDSVEIGKAMLPSKGFKSRIMYVTPVKSQL